jgi:hypothetical protein
MYWWKIGSLFERHEYCFQATNSSLRYASSCMGDRQVGEKMFLEKCSLKSVEAIVIHQTMVILTILLGYHGLIRRQINCGSRSRLRILVG